MRFYSDEQLIEVYKTQTGSQRRKAFDYLYNRYIDSIRKYIFYSSGKDYEKAKDIAQDVFMKVLETPDKFDINKKFKPWLYKVTTNLCINDFKKKEVANKHIGTEEFNQINKVETRDNLRNSIKNLPIDQRSLIVLRFKLNLSIKEIADIYECPEGTIKSRMFYATKMLSQLYKN